MLVGGWATLPQKKSCIIVIACNSNPPKKKKVNDHFVYQLSYGHAIWPTASVLCKTFRYSKPSKNVLANVGFTLAAISLPFWDGLSNIPCQCSGKSNMYPKHVHDTLGDKWRVHNNYLVDYILIHAPKGHHRKSGRSYRIRFSWDVHFLRKNSCALLANPKAVFRRAGSRFTLVRLPPTQASNTPTWNQTMNRLLQAGMVWNSLSPGPILSESKLKQSMVIVWIQLRESIRNHEKLLKLETWNKNWNHCTC